MELFDFIKNYFFDKEKYKQVKDRDKKAMFFMVQRFMSIEYPEATNVANITGVNQILIMDNWHRQLCKRYTRPPQFFFISSKSKNKKPAKKNKFKMPSGEVLKTYLTKNEMDMHEFEFAVDMFPDELQKELKVVEAYLKDKD